MPKTALIIAGFIFLIVAIAHILRLIYEFEFRIAGYDIPLWLNVIGSIVMLGLSFLMFKAASLARRS
ncbi:MAG: hypothetical protein ABH871_05255 [Pseudomonadota bacterium]